MPQDDALPPRPRAGFVTTQWSLVVAAGAREDPKAREALAALCRTYWEPIHSYVRRRGADRDRALDLTQGFFAKLLEKNYIAEARRERGRFRTFLLAALNHYLSNERDRERAQRRGGGEVHVSLDETDREGSLRREASHEETPEKEFDRHWARTVLRSSLDRLRSDAIESGGTERFEKLLPYASGEGEGRYKEVAAALGMTESAVRVAVHRLRGRAREALREQVAQTVGDPSEIDDEVRHLIAVLAS